MPTTKRRQLKKFRRFLNKNRSWLCDKGCSYSNPECELRVFTFQLNYSYKSNKQADILTFKRHPFFAKVYKLYCGYENNNQWNNYEVDWGKIIQHINFCKCM